MSGHDLTVGRQVVVDMVRLAAMEVPGVQRVGRGGPPWRDWGRPPISVDLHDDVVEVRLFVVARPGQALAPLTSQIRSQVGATVERLLGLRLASATVIVDGVVG